jgi:hypothetical protein
MIGQTARLPAEIYVAAAQLTNAWAKIAPIYDTSGQDPRERIWDVYENFVRRFMEQMP